MGRPFHLIALFTLLLLGSALRSAAWTNPDPPLEEHLRIGLRFRQSYLHDHSRSIDNAYRGSITELNSQEDESPLTPLTIEWLFNPYIGTQLTWEQVRAETGTSQATEALNHSDGNISLFGPALTLKLRCPNQTRLTPFIGLGYSLLAANFKHNPVWHNGFGGFTREADYDAWVAAGRPPWPNKGYRRTITLEDASAWLLTCGLEIQITDQLDVNLFAQVMDVDGTDLTQRLSLYEKITETKHGTFPMSNTSYGLGVRWTF
ncbi:MAG: hypothetical protein R6X19_10610 [Kiritimatiellia bacterium]